MSLHDGPNTPPDLEDLAAYADGRLSAPDKQRVEEWLAAYPEDAERVEEWYRVQALWQATAAPEPTEADWERVFRGVELGVARGRHEPAKPGRGRSRVAALAAVAAAVVALVASFNVGRVPPGDLPDVVEPFAVASNEDVEITSVDDAGAAALVVGEPPLRKPIVLMAPADIALRSVARGKEGSFPEVRLQPEADAAPMILGPVAAGLDAP